ncbi:MAG: conserved phage C-terminal domain-containing protein [Desulfosarcina sp.]|nr:conserved phage C-terminal domain-containing protein [Desulfosarcina sp.]MBC2764492.1 hypothetical protein [Desulfosarcina sp.]
MNYEYCWLRNRFLDKLITFYFTGQQRQCLDLIIRETYGRQLSTAKLPQREFAKRTGIAKRSVTRVLKELEKHRIIHCLRLKPRQPVEYRINENYHEWQKIDNKKTSTVRNPDTSTVRNPDTSTVRNPDTSKNVLPINSFLKTRKKEIKNIVFNTTSTILHNPGEKEFSFFSSIQKILDRLNNKLGSQVFRPGNYHTETMLMELFTNGFTEQDCMDVIDEKARQWLDSETFRKNLRPKTLFSQANFEGYLQEARFRQQQSQQPITATQPDLPAVGEMPTPEQFEDIKNRLRKLGIGAKGLDDNPESREERLQRLRAQAEKLRAEN